jgi:hypothetical protein
MGEGEKLNSRFDGNADLSCGSSADQDSARVAPSQRHSTATHKYRQRIAQRSAADHFHFDSGQKSQFTQPAGDAVIPFEVDNRGAATALEGIQRQTRRIDL